MSQYIRNQMQLPLPFEGVVIEIPLSRGFVAIIDAVDADLVPYSWYKSSQGYVQRYPLGKPENAPKVVMHRVILERMLGRPLQTSERTDHINGNGLDNRRSNLRVATHAQNIQNSKRPINNTSGLKGAHRDGNKWHSSITVNGKIIHLGYFDTPEEAHQAYCEAAIKYHGEFARFE